MSLKLAEEKASAERMDKLRRLNHKMDMLRAQISDLTLDLEALESLHTDLTYLQEN